MSQIFHHCQVAILAGGMGTRLKVRTGNLPKPMAPILGIPVLEHQIRLCKKYGFSKIALLVHYEHEAITNYFGDGTAFGVELTYVVETDARGTAGALRDALDIMSECFLVLYADTYADVDLSEIWNAHLQTQSAATLLLHPNDHPHDSDLVELDELSHVVAVHPYPHPENVVYSNLVNAALYVLNRDGLKDVIPESGKSDLAKNTFPEMIRLGKGLLGYVTPEYIKDMGTPARLDKVENDIVAGLPERLSSRHFRTAVFLDRDGTLNEEVNHLNSPSQLKLLPGVANAVHILNRAGILAVGVTNQPVVARGDVTWDQLKQIHASLDHLLGADKAYLDRMYVCPHHPDSGFEGEVPELKKDCNCRKPKVGMFEQAIAELNISRRHSWMVGDTTSDILAGKRAGLRTVLVKTGYAGLDAKYAIKPDFTMHNLSDAVRWIISGYSKIYKQLLPVVQPILSQESRVILIGGLARSGKSSSARVLVDMLGETGKKAHLLSLDNWLVPQEARNEGEGVLGRYDLASFKRALQNFLEVGGRANFSIPEYEPKSKKYLNTNEISVGCDDLFVIEGVPALLDTELLTLSEIRIFVSIEEGERKKRFEDEYAWRGEQSDVINMKIAQRDLDEKPMVLDSRNMATQVIFGDLNDSK